MQTTYNGLPLPADGAPIEYKDGKFTVPDNPIIPFIEGDGTGRDIWKASQRVFDAAVEKAYGGKRSIKWFEIFAGEKAYRQFSTWLPDDSVNAARDFRVSIKGPLTTPVGGGIRSLNVALRQILDLYSCVRPVKYYAGVPSPGEAPREARHRPLPRKHRRRLLRHRVQRGHGRRGRLIAFLNNDCSRATKKQVRLDSGVGIKPISIFGTKRLVRAPSKALSKRPQDRHARPQGQHPEVHRRRIPRVGLRSRSRGVPRPDRHRARELDPRQCRSQPLHHRRRERSADRARHRIRHRSLPRSRMPR
jgi:isocitrate dehydrogenase